MIDEVLKERKNNYGDFADNALVSVMLKENLRNGVNWMRLTPMQREALDMICHKISRIVNGNPNYKDSWTDIVGYASLVEKELGEDHANKPNQ